MDIRQLRYFIAIAEEGTITKAAEALHMAQPPLSRQLKLIEDELGVMLFERNKKKKVTLTNEGKLFLKKAKQVLFTLEEAIIEVQEFGEEISGTLSIGSTIYNAPLLLSTLKEFRKKYPQVNFSIWEGNSIRLMELLDNHQIDIALSGSSFAKDRFEMIELDKDPCVFIVPKDFEVETDNVDINTITTFPLILLGPSEGNTLYDQIINEFKRLDLVPSILCECHDSAMLLNLVSMGFGATILPLSLANAQLKGDFNILPIEKNPWETQPALIWRSNSYLSVTAKEFLRFFQEKIRE
ncbi:LysR family transcriptional regulator [Neobacillus pocheonensis]|uniref:LysR family transcriptional regulator n=1 Tax=Neobacillus pocheonensis TaxID=363869 RepID=A0ABT0WF94_9BACI|nr:LysR family transcriptional regulator [Neobacillus pocheonensis]